MTTCSICQGAMRLHFTARVLGRHDVRYYHCAACGFVGTETPYWLAEAYTQALAKCDTGVVMRNMQAARRLAAMLYVCLGERGTGRWLDYAGGYGLLTRMMRDFGFDFCWADKYAANLMSPGFEFRPGWRCRGVTALEAIEHAPDPRAFVREALGDTGAELFVFTTETYRGDPPAKDWWYYSFNTGQHVSFFQPRTLARLGTSLGFHYYPAGQLHVYSRRRLSGFLLKLVTGKPAILLEPVIRRLMKSLVVPDHAKLAGEEVLPAGREPIAYERPVNSIREVG